MGPDLIHAGGRGGLQSYVLAEVDGKATPQQVRVL